MQFSLATIAILVQLALAAPKPESQHGFQLNEHGPNIEGDAVAAGKRAVGLNPISLGIETTGGFMSKIMPRNAEIPSQKSQIFSTATDNQSGVLITVYEGERAKVDDNKELGKFGLIDIPAAPRGVPQIEVSFEFDETGDLKVSATDKGTDKSESITINGEDRSTPTEINDMIEEAEENSEEDEEAAREAEEFFEEGKSTIEAP